MGNRPLSYTPVSMERSSASEYLAWGIHVISQILISSGIFLSLIYFLLVLYIQYRKIVQLQASNSPRCKKKCKSYVSTTLTVEKKNIPESVSFCTQPRRSRDQNELGNVTLLCAMLRDWLWTRIFNARKSTFIMQTLYVHLHVPDLAPCSLVVVIWK